MRTRCNGSTLKRIFFINHLFFVYDLFSSHLLPSRRDFLFLNGVAGALMRRFGCSVLPQCIPIGFHRQEVLEFYFNYSQISFSQTNDFH